MLWSIIYCSSPDGHFEKYYNTMAGLMYVSSEVSWWERDYQLHIVEIDKIGTKYSMHKIAHAKHWELPTSSSEGCIAYWNINNRQTDRMKAQIFVSKQAWMIVPSVIKWTALCVCVVHSWNLH